MRRHDFHPGDLIEDRKTGLIGLVYGVHQDPYNITKRQVYFYVWWMDNSRGYRKSLVSPTDKRVRSLSKKHGERKVVRNNVV